MPKKKVLAFFFFLAFSQNFNQYATIASSLEPREAEGAKISRVRVSHSPHQFRTSASECLLKVAYSVLISDNFFPLNDFCRSVGNT